MKIFLLFGFILSYIPVFAQNFHVLDSITKEPLSFAIIKTSTGGFYTDEAGKFNYKTNELIEVYYLGYKDKVVNTRTTKDTILLIPKIITLNEVIINSNQQLSKIGFLNHSATMSNYPVNPKNEILICIYSDNKYVGSYIQSIYIPLNKIKHYNKTDKLYKNAPGVFRINIYEIENNLPGNKIYNSKPIKFIMSEREKIEFDLSDNMIMLPKEGLAFGLEMIGRVDNNGNFIEDNSYMRPLLTDIVSPDYSAITYKREIFSKENKFYPINEVNQYLARDLKNYKYKDYNLAIGLTLIR